MPSKMKTKVTNGEGKGELNLCHFLVVGALEPFIEINFLLSLMPYNKVIYRYFKFKKKYISVKISKTLFLSVLKFSLKNILVSI